MLLLLLLVVLTFSFSFFFFTDPPPTEIYTLSLHDALPILFGRGRKSRSSSARVAIARRVTPCTMLKYCSFARTSALFIHISDRKSTRLNSSHLGISYAVFCLKKKKEKIETNHSRKK